MSPGTRERGRRRGHPATTSPPSRPEAGDLGRAARRLGVAGGGRCPRLLGLDCAGPLWAGGGSPGDGRALLVPREDSGCQARGRVMSCPFVILTTAECLAVPTVPRHDAWQNAPPHSHCPAQAPLPLTVIDSLGRHFPEGTLPDASLQDALGRKRVLWSNTLGECCILCPRAGHSQGPLSSSRL